VSTYSKLPKKAKIAGVQHGLRRIVVRDVSSVGCPKVLELWVPLTEWLKDAKSIVDKTRDAASSLRGISSDRLMVEIP
jgi:hypothetical protein